MKTKVYVEKAMGSDDTITSKLKNNPTLNSKALGKYIMGHSYNIILNHVLEDYLKTQKNPRQKLLDEKSRIKRGANILKNDPNFEKRP